MSAEAERETETSHQPGSLRQRLSSATAIQLGSALVSFVAERSNIRAFLIKGLVLEQLGLRRARQYSDIDVMVDPARFDDFVAALAAIGWHERVHFWFYDRIEEHSTTLIHDSWPVDIDVHRYFPGFLAPEQEVFEELWVHRREFAIAGRQVIGTDEAAASVILALHALRWMHTTRNVEEYKYLIERLRALPETRTHLIELAAATGSSDTLAPLFEALGLHPVEGRPVSHRDLMDWRRRVSHPSRTGEWVAYISRTPKKHWPRELRLAMWPPAEMYLQDHPDVANTFGSLFRARIHRLLHGAAGMVRVIRASARRDR